MLYMKRRISYFRFKFLKAYMLCFAMSFWQNKYSTSIVNNNNEHDDACRLLYQEYRKRNYCEEKTDKKHSSKYMHLPESRTFVLKDTKGLCGTISLFPDSKEGLPMQSIFKEELEILRAQGARIAEVGLLALNTQKTRGYSLSTTKRMLPLFSLFKAMTLYALSKKITHLVIIVNPKHSKLYEFFGFVQFSEVRYYPGACNAPALPLILKLEEAFNNLPGLVRRYFNENNKIVREGPETREWAFATRT